MKKIIFFLQLTIFVFFASCSGEDPDLIPEPIPSTGEVEHTIFVYMPWSGVTNGGVVRNISIISLMVISMILNTQWSNKEAWGISS